MRGTTLAERRGALSARMLFVLLLAAGCATDHLEASAPERDGFVPLDDDYIVNCVLPGQIRRFGQMTQVTKPRPARLKAYLCRLRGGQYIEFDRADPTTSVGIWETLAESGDADAQLMLGRLNHVFQLLALCSVRVLGAPAGALICASSLWARTYSAKALAE